MSKLRDAIDKGGGQTCNVEGVVREMVKLGIDVVTRELAKEMGKPTLTVTFGDGASCTIPMEKLPEPGDTVIVTVEGISSPKASSVVIVPAKEGEK